ncbi:hypothetical protein FSP39_010101 [Pinctada imbricata]|uniref:Uncharacterized protein n=1 Tax=Pinctada imbricata TaxID=66713 RepID=A0AA88YKA7_PINIB|nr:hypothetical protein FSP39_010101 [Pinctada imbricata]
MARLRFPGRPGCRFDRQGVRYGADEAKNVQDPTLSFVASIHRGLLAFRELVGASDEEEDFEGFTPDDLRKAENKLEEELNRFVQTSPKPKSQHHPAFVDTSPGKLGTRLTTSQENLENLPTSERTRNRKSTLIRKSYKLLLTEGLATPRKLYNVKKKRDLNSAQDEARSEVKKWLKKRSPVPSPDKPSFQPRFKLTTDGRLVKRTESVDDQEEGGIIDVDSFEGTNSDLLHQDDHRKNYKDRDKPSHHFKVTKPANKGIARQLLQKAKNSNDKGQSSGVKVQKKRFVLPVQSSRSSRVIIPNKRFLEEDSENFLHVVAKRPAKEKDVPVKKDVSTMLSIETPDVGLFAVPPTSEAEKLPILPLSSLSPAIPKTSGLSGFSLFQQQKPMVTEPPLLDQPLIVEGKRTRKPSLKVRMKMSETSFQRFREMSFEKKLQARKAIEQEKQRTIQDSHPETKKILLTPSKLAPTLSPKLPMIPIMAPPKFGVSPFSSLGERERLEKLEREAHATRMRGHNILRKAKLQLNRAALNRSKADLARTLKKEMKKEAKMEEILKKEMKKEAKMEETRQKQQQNVSSPFLAPSGLSFSTTGRGWSEASQAEIEAGPGKKTIPKKKTTSRRELMRCRVCDLILKDQKVGYHGIPSCHGCWKFFRRILRLSHERSCPKKNDCRIHYTEKPLCTACRFKKCKSVFPSIDKLKHIGSGPLHSESDKKGTEKLGTEGEDVVDDTEENGGTEGPEINQHKPEPVTPQPTAVSLTTAGISPVPMATSSPETNDSPRSDGRGPRIKHVCRKAAVVLGKPVAKFPAKSPEITLSALPSGEKVKLWKKDQETRKEYSDDEMPLEDIIQQSEDHTVVVRKTPLKSPPKAAGRVLQGKRKKRCMKCEGCLNKDCGTCVNCLDNPKFGGPGTKRKACKFRVCRFPIYKKVLLRDSDSDFGDSPSSSPGKAPPGGNKKASTSQRGTTLSVIQRMALQGQGSNNVGKKSTRERTVSKQPQESKTPMDVSRHLLSSFGGSGHGGGGIHVESANFSLVSVSGPGRRPTKFKDKMYGGLKTDSVTMTSVVGARSWIADATMAEHKVKADYKDNLEYVSVWQYGVTVTITGPMCVRTVCLLCGSAGKHEFLYCNICCEPFHEFCLEEEERPLEDKLEDWCCKRCQFCHVCGRQNNLLQCDKCQNTYHPECLGPNYPTKPSKRKKIWICTKCVRCKSCGATTPGTASSATWTYDFQLCYECGQLMDKGNFCPVCHKCYSDDDWESKMVQCVSCESWVHAKCEGLTDEMYERVSYLPEDIHYICRICSPDGVRHWEQVVRSDFLVGIQAIMGALMQAKCSQHLLYIDEEKLKTWEKTFDSQNKDLQFKSVTMVTDKNETKDSESKLKEDPLEVQKKSKQLEQSLEDFVSMLDKVLKSKTKFEIPPPSLNLNVKELDQSNADKMSCDTANEGTSGVGGSMELEEKNSDPIPAENKEDELSDGSNFTSNQLDQKSEECESESRTGLLNEESDDEQMEIDVENDSMTENDAINSSVTPDVFKEKEGQEHRDEVDGSRLLVCQALRNLVEKKNSIELNESPSESCFSNDALKDLNVQGMNESEMKCDDDVSEGIGTGNNFMNESDGREIPAINTNTNELESNEIKQSNSQQISVDEVEEFQNLIDQSDSVKHDECSVDQSEDVLQNDEAAQNSSQIATDLCSSTASMERNSESTLSAQSDSFLHNQLNQSDVSIEDTRKKSSVSFDTSVISRGEITPTKGDKQHVRFMEGLLNPMSKRDYPKDFVAVERKMELHLYTTLEEFAEDVARIINLSLNDVDETRVIRKKATNSVRSIFIKQLEKYFPWYNTKASILWDNNQNFPQGMLADAVLPPSIDHTYAQWLERQDIPKSPQPSPFKRVQNTPIKKTLPVLDDEDAEKILFTDLEDAGEDTRRCILCWHYGDSDPNDAGRLLYTGQDDWVHINCALWSAEVYEEEHDGSLKNVQTAVSRGRNLKCDRCGRSGATVGCCTRGCPANYHFMCAKQSYCVFQEDMKMFCQLHRLIRKEKFAVLRRVSVSTEDSKSNKKTWAKGLDPAVISIIIGSCTIEDLGKLSPLSDTKEVLLPMDFCSTRVFWSTRDARKRCVYTCTIREVKPNSPTGQIKIRDMTIIHDETHPDFVPFSDLDLQGINLFPKKARMSESMEIIDLSDDSSLLRSFNSSGDYEILQNTSTDCEILNSTARDYDALDSVGSGRFLSSSFNGQQSGREVVEESLSKSWPIVPKKSETVKKPKSSLRSSVNLSVLSPNTLKLLNIKDPAKYASPKTQPATQKLKSKDDDFGTLIKIADRLNCAAANRFKRGKSEERAPSGLPPLSQRGRSRSRSVDRLISPPRLALSSGGQSGSSSRSSSRSGSVDRVFSPVDNGRKSVELQGDHTVQTPLLSVAEEGLENSSKTVGSLQPISEENQSRITQPIGEENQDRTIRPISEENQSENPQPISEENGTSSSNEPLIMLQQNDLDNLSEEDCLLIAQMALAQGQGQNEEKVANKSDKDDLELMDVDPQGGMGSQGHTGASQIDSQDMTSQRSEDVHGHKSDLCVIPPATNITNDGKRTYGDTCPTEKTALLSPPIRMMTQGGSHDHFQPIVEHSSNIRMHKVVTPKKVVYPKELTNVETGSSKLDIKNTENERAVEEIIKKDFIPVYNKNRVLVGFKSPTATDSPDFQKKLLLYRDYGIPYYKQGQDASVSMDSSVLDAQNYKLREEFTANHSVLIVPKTDLGFSRKSTDSEQQVVQIDSVSIPSECSTDQLKESNTSTNAPQQHEEKHVEKFVVEEGSEENPMVSVSTEPVSDDYSSKELDVETANDDSFSDIKDLEFDGIEDSEILGLNSIVEGAEEISDVVAIKNGQEENLEADVQTETSRNDVYNPIESESDEKCADVEDEKCADVEEQCADVEERCADVEERCADVEEQCADVEDGTCAELEDEKYVGVEDNNCAENEGENCAGTEGENCAESEGENCVDAEDVKCADKEDEKCAETEDENCAVVDEDKCAVVDDEHISEGENMLHSSELNSEVMEKVQNEECENEIINSEQSEEDELPVQTDGDGEEVKKDLFDVQTLQCCDAEADLSKEEPVSLEKGIDERDVKSDENVSVIEISTESEGEDADASVLEISTESEDKAGNIDEDVMVLSLGSEDEEQSETCVPEEFEKHFNEAGEDPLEDIVTGKNFMEDGVPEDNVPLEAEDSEGSRRMAGTETIELSSAEDSEDHAVEEYHLLKEDSLSVISKEDALQPSNEENCSEHANASGGAVTELEDKLLADDATCLQDCETDSTSVDEDDLLREEEEVGQNIEETAIDLIQAERMLVSEEDSEQINEDHLLEENEEETCSC